MFLETPNQHQIELISTTHKEKSRLCKEQEIITTGIKNQLTRDFNDRNIAELHYNHIGHNDLSIQQLLEHVCENYGNLDENDLEATKKC